MPIILTVNAGCNRVDISTYKGDGEIIRTGGYLISYGFEIYFDDVDLTKPFLKQYQLIDYPKINKTYDFGLVIMSKEDEISKFLKGTLSLKLIEPLNNKIIFEWSAPMIEWSDGRYKTDDGLYEHFLYYFENKTGKGSFFDLKDLPDTRKLILTVNYDPKSTMVNMSGSIRLRVGGTY